MEETYRLAKAVLDWWSDHQSDTARYGDHEWLIYSDKPEFVEIAEQMLAERIDE